MQKEIRRKERAMDTGWARRLLEEADHGFLGLAAPDGQPYVVPVNHVVVDGHIVIHSANEGQKLDMVRANPLVCYTVCTQHEVLPEVTSTRYQSAMAFGKAEIVEDVNAKKPLLVALMKRLAPGLEFVCDDEKIARTCVLRIKIGRVTGKKRE